MNPKTDNVFWKITRFNQNKRGMKAYMASQCYRNYIRRKKNFYGFNFKNFYET